MNLPLNYEWLRAELSHYNGPRLVVEGVKLLGTHEIVGQKNSPIIMGWAKELGIDNIYPNDEMAWCGLAMARVITNADKPLGLRDYDILRAESYRKWGVHVDVPMFGDVLIF